MPPGTHKMEIHTPPRISEPIAISLVSRGYFVYDVDVIMHLRRRHHICGVLRGSLPLFPQQNVFLGVPLELMPEEARLLADKGAANIVNDYRLHMDMLHTLSKEERTAFSRSLAKKGVEIAKDAEYLAGRKRKDALQRLQRGKAGSHTSPLPDIGTQKVEETSQRRQVSGEVEDNALFDVPSPRPEGTLDSATSSVALEPYRVTPTTSSILIHPPTAISAADLPEVPSSYPLFAHLHDKGYYISPGLRFGCQYLVYPGDPLRFHSHFLATSMGWDEDFDLIDIVAGGRLGTGVKKGYLIGGVKEPNLKVSDDASHPSPCVRTFCIEWGGM